MRTANARPQGARPEQETRRMFSGGLVAADQRLYFFLIAICLATLGQS
jgi:hypothetical protein